MAIEIEITKEIGNYEPKFVGPLTIRQTACLSVAVPICILIYVTLSPVLTGDVAGFFCIIPAGFAAAFGWLKPYGMKAEEFLRSVFMNTLVAPSNRKYIIENQSDVHMDSLSEQAEHDSLEPKNLDKEDTNPEDDKSKKKEKNKNRPNKKKKKKKYKVSSEAVR